MEEREELRLMGCDNIVLQGGIALRDCFLLMTGIRRDDGDGIRWGGDRKQCKGGDER